MNRTYLFIAISSVALLMVLLIQVNWIFQTAKIKEELFNEKANMVLSRTTETLALDKETCQKIGACVDNNGNTESTNLGQDETNKIDSLFKHYMKFYNFHIDYSFVVVQPQTLLSNNGSGFANFIYNKELEDVITKNRIELKLLFPEKKQYLLAEMGPLFITSIVLILVVLILFWRTTLSLLREKQLSEQTTDFLNNMTHEFKTPLTNIALASKLILKDSTLKQEEKVKYYTGIILEENDKLRLQVEQVLSMRALERGEIPLQKTVLDFHALILDVVKSMSIQLENKQGHLNLNLTANKFLLLGDKIHLTNTLQNLMDNAIKYCDKKPELSIQTKNVGSNLVLLISDNGIGIDKMYQQKVFDTYFRIPTGNIHDVKGFGLGLAYIKKIVELHDGMIELQSERGTGSTFKITLKHV